MISSSILSRQKKAPVCFLGWKNRLESLGKLDEKAEQALEQQMPELEREEPEEGFGMPQQM